ncbi:hypothetical protein PDE_06902 [Penicillium oxalicum 114-2]|uniref:Transcription factor Iwr1 domain-containing protein n=1 Tax=Penicillium oxalicum (strain 114-2 / CGMCC 5302) TaxID=933388 RepID=S8AZR4_PENO1|nr:hypothetical protein PDE_06902 [Penicillium oxalicum 114-2]
MSLPPEQINIKRRREEEPVETLYIQSATRQTKRRFTDYVFERVTLSRKDVAATESTPLPPGNPAAQRLLRTPRSVSSLHIPNRRAAAAAAAAATQPTNSNGIPVVRATSPGAEIREAHRLAAARKDAEEKRQRLLQTPPQPPSAAHLTPSQAPSTPPEQEQERGGETLSVPGLSSRAQSLRRFQISRSSSPSLGAPGTIGGGIQKRRTDGAAPGVAVLVEQLRRQPHSRKASMVAGLVDQARLDASVNNEESDNAPVKPRKRPVVNQAEKKWRAERQSAINAAKQHLSEVLDKSARQTNHTTWEEESERLAKDFEQVALELEQEQDRARGHEMELDDHAMDMTTEQQPRIVPPPISSPKPMKYQPRPPKQPRAIARPAASQTEMEGVVAGVGAGAETGSGTSSALAEEDEDDYVYDVYIRRLLSEREMLTNPLAELESEQQLQQIEAANRGIGVIVITAEDEEYWENFVEDEEEEWDSEDADSNAENNPANEYPDEELSSSDEEDDPTAIYRKYRHRAASDDEEYDIDDSGSEGGAPFGSKYGFSQRYAGDGDSDEDSY